MPICTTVPTFVPVGKAVPEIWLFIECFTMAAVRHLGFLKVGNFNCPCPCVIVPNFVQMGRTVAEIWSFTIFQDGGRHLRFSKVGYFNCPCPWRSKMRYRTKFCADRSNRCGDMAVYDFSRWRPSAIFDFQKLEILTARTLRGAKMRHRAKNCADRSRRCGDMTVFDFSRWRPSAILDFK